MLSVFFFSIGKMILSWEEDITYTHQQSSWQPMVWGFVVRSECISEELVWTMPEFIFLLNFIFSLLILTKWQKSTNLKAKADLIWHGLKPCWEICASTTELFRYQSNMRSVIGWTLCVALLWKRIWHCTQKPGHSTSQLPKAYLNRIKQLKLNSLMKHLPRSCLPKVIEDKWRTCSQNSCEELNVFCPCLQKKSLYSLLLEQNEKISLKL